MILSDISRTIRETVRDPKRAKAVWGPKRTLALVALIVFIFGLAPDALARTARRGTWPGVPSTRVQNYELDNYLTGLTRRDRGMTADVIVVLEPGQTLGREFMRYVRGPKLDIINGYALDNIPVRFLIRLSSQYNVHRVHWNRDARSQDLLSSAAVQADVLAKQYGYSGAGVTVAVIDSGFTSHPSQDLNDDRIVKFVDFVNRTNRLRSDPNGHGTHVTGIVAGTGAIDSKYAGIAPGTKVISLRVLDETGKGSIGDIIAAMDWVSKNAALYNIRVVTMSVGAGVYESYWTDPLTLAAKALVDQGITVVTAAGNFGKNKQDELQWGGVTSPGVAPWVLTVCAFSTMGTTDLGDDQMASFSSAGPTAVDFTAKPDICAPGVGVVSLSAPESFLYNQGALASPSWLIGGDTLGYSPYISLSGTSQATPFVTGTVALMLQANPNLTPNLIKAILQYTATFKPDVSPLRQGGGFMNTLGAVTLARFYANPQPGSALPIDPAWSQQIIWGNNLLSGGILDPNANAWMPGVEWGWARTQATDGDNIVWGTLCADCDNIVWGTASDSDNIVWGTHDAGDNIVWGTFGDDNIVWGTWGDDDNIVWGTYGDDDNIVWGTHGGDDNIVWGTHGGDDNIVWGTWGDDDNIVWGTHGGDDNIVWGTVQGDDNIVWGTDCGGADCDNVVWGSFDPADNIVWGTASDGDNIVWGTWGDDNIVWGTFGDDNIVWGTIDAENVVWPVYLDAEVSVASNSAPGSNSNRGNGWPNYGRKGGK